MSTLQACILGVAVWSPALAAGDELAAAFRSPPDAARPWTYRWWLNGHVSREGITADLEAMKRRGIGGVLIFNAGGGATPPGLTFMEPEWLATYGHALGPPRAGDDPGRGAGIAVRAGRPRRGAAPWNDA